MKAPSKLLLDDQLCFALYAATNSVTRAYRPLLKSLDLTYPQYLVMMVLWQDGTRPARAIAERLQLPPNAISPLLDRIEAGGLITRRRDANDKRIVHIGLTEKGAALEAAAAEAQNAVACRTHLGHGEIAELREELHRLTRRLAAEPCRLETDTEQRSDAMRSSSDDQAVR